MLLAVPLAGPALYRAFGLGAVALALVLVWASLRGSRVPVQCRRGLYTPAGLSRLDRRGLAGAVERMLGRDGWQVTDLTERARRAALRRDAHGRELDEVVQAMIDISLGANVTGDGAPAGSAPPSRGRHRLVVHRGSCGRADILWVARHPRVQLVDGVRLNRWAGGTPLSELDPPG
ncbi:hypothetical protein ABT127_30290 [Streptomyces sp. NPDC001904]|uniref:hypothetical protein n=1 Tax=Streptomyces sp. NPDC001904 TaxID=3154531 RepID=UPI00332670B6